MELVISKFEGEIQQRILDKLNTEYFSTGKYVKDQMSVSPKVLSSLMLSSSVVGTGISSAISPQLFIATANPKNLMSLGMLSKGSAVIGEGGKIIKQAGFVPVPGAIPVVAPLMAVNALTSVAMLQQFSVVNEKLFTIQTSINKVLARQEATSIAELFTAVHMIDEIYSQYGQMGLFSADMLVRLALMERDIAILSRRYRLLEELTMDDASKDSFDNQDAYCAILTSFLNLRVKYLRTCVDVQENPQFVRQSKEGFSEVLKDSINLWDKLLNKSEKMKAHIEALTAQVETENVFEKITKSQKKELSRKKDAYTSVMEKERVILQDFHKLIDLAKQMSESSNEHKSPTIIYWNDVNGEHCFTTNEQILDILES